MSVTPKLTLPAKTADTAQPKVATRLKEAQQRLGFLPNMYANMANAPGLLETYLDGYERFRSDSGFSPAEQEVIFLTISDFHACTYCMAAHSMIAEKMSKVPGESLAALRAGQTLPDAKLQRLAEFTRAMLVTRGRPTERDLQRFTAAGYTERQVLEIILAIAVKTLSNYSNHLFHTKVDPAFASYEWKPRGEL